METNNYRFYRCKAFDEGILKLCEKKNAHFHAPNEHRLKEPLFDNIAPPAVVFLQFQQMIVAYGEVEEIGEVDETVVGEGYKDWKYRIKLNEEGWVWVKENHMVGEEIFHTNEFIGPWRLTIAEVKPDKALAKMKKINPKTDLVRKIEREIKTTKDMERINEYVTLLESNHNLILTGAPGTGKTFLAKKIAAKMILGEDYDDSNNKVEQDPRFREQCSFVQFHPSYDYTDFVEGLRPINKDGNVGFERQDGIFKQFCKEAMKNKENEEKKYVFIIDEINRGDISKILGELFFSIDPGYRGEEGKVKTQYQNLLEKGDDYYDGFYVPKNVYIIGTMNDIDRSVESMDFAMRRRFAWKEIMANENVGMLDKIDKDKDEAIKRMERLNKAIEETEGLSTAYHIGASYFLKLDLYKEDADRWASLWNNHIKGVLYEYLRGNENIEEAMRKLKDAYDKPKETATPVEDNEQTTQTDAQG